MRPKSPQWLRDAERVDEAIYAAIAVTPTPTLDSALGALARAADRSLIWLVLAALSVRGANQGAACGAGRGGVDRGRRPRSSTSA